MEVKTLPGKGVSGSTELLLITYNEREKAGAEFQELHQRIARGE